MKKHFKHSLILFSLFLLWRCSYYDLKTVASCDEINSAVLDTNNFISTTNLSSHLNITDDLCGNYAFDINPGFQGIGLVLKKDSTFSESHWSDMMQPMLFIKKGKWFIRNNQLVLKDRTQKKYYYYYYKYAWTIFLVPVNKNKLFQIQFQKNKNTIDSLAKFVEKERLSKQFRRIYSMNQLCFHKWITN